MRLPLHYLKTSFLLLFTTLTLGLFAQNEEKGFSFQGYARDFSGAALSSQTIVAKFSIYPEGESDEYVEEQTLDTDAFGVFSAVIGAEAASDFAAIDFSANKYFLKVEVREVSAASFSEISNAELLAVPYAKSAQTALNGVPAGTILPFAGPAINIPDGYLACDGATLSVDDYPALHDAIGFAWGGDGATSFNTPDLRGQFMRGWDDGEGVDPDSDDRFAKNTGGATGDAVGSYQEDAAMQHTHNHYRTPSGGEVGQSGSGAVFVGNENTNQPVSTLGINGSSDHISSETRPDNAYVLFIIKY